MNGRRKTRALVSLVARYRSPTVFEFVEEQCFDLSEGGMFIKSQAPAPAGTLLKIECTVGDGPQQITAVARVVWLRELDAEDGPRGMGVKFVKLEAGSPEVIRDVLSRASASLPPPASPSTTPPSSTISKSEPAPAAPQPTSAAEPGVATAAASASTSTNASTVTATSGPAPAAAPRAGADASGTPIAAWAVAAAVIIALVVFATRSKPTAPPATAIAPVQVGASTTAQPAPQAVAPTPEPEVAPEPITPTPEPEVAPEPVQPTPEAAATPEAIPAPAPIAPGPVVAPTAPTTAAGMPFAVNVVSTPKGAQITADSQRCTAPCTLRFADLTSPVKVTAEAVGYRMTAATLDAQSGFTERDAVMHKTLYLKLNPDPATARPAIPREAPEAAAE